MNVSETLSLKDTNKGKRTFIKNRESINSGFLEGKPIDVIYHPDHVEVILSDDGKRQVAKGNIIDIQSKRMNQVFPDASRVNISYQDSRILITAHYNENKKKEREDRVRHGHTLKIGELFAGTGNLSLQIKRGLKSAGIDTQCSFANEICPDKAYVLANNKELWDNKKAKLFIDDIMTMDLGELPTTDILVLGYPCVGFSMMQTNRAKRDFHHPQAGVLFVRVLEAINRINPSVIILENSPQMRESETLFIMDTVLHATGYKSEHTTLKGSDFGDFEPRERMMKVYYSEGLADLDLNAIMPSLSMTRTVADILEPSSVKPTDWKPYDYLRKHGKNPRHGHGFFVASMNDTKLKTMGANYGKAQPDTSFLPHDSDDQLFRMFTPQEHANIRRFPCELKTAIHESAEGGGLFYQRGSRTRAHKVLGDSVSPLPWQAAGKAIGQWLSQNQHGTAATTVDFNEDILLAI